MKAVRVLRRLTTDDIWPPKYWQQFLRTIAHVPGELTPNAKLQNHVARVVCGAPDELFAAVGSAAADFVKGLANLYETDREEALGKLWTKAWFALGMDEPAEFADSDEPITEALSHPAGKLADAAVIRLLKYKRRVGDGLPTPVRRYFDAIAAHPYGHLGRVMLATRLRYLFALDQEGVKRCLVPLLSPRDSAEAANLWYAYGWSRTIGPDLLQAIKEPFLEVLRHGQVGVRTERNLTTIFMAICLEAPNELTDDEIASVVDSMSEQDLTTALECLTHRLTGEPAEQAQIWHKKVGPWLERYWPRAGARNTATTSNAMLNILAVCGDAFAEAVEWALDRLQPTHKGLFGLGRTQLPERHPEMTLAILDKVVGEEGVRLRHRDTLRQILETIRVAMPHQAKTAKFQRLYRFAVE